MKLEDLVEEMDFETEEIDKSKGASSKCMFVSTIVNDLISIGTSLLLGLGLFYSLGAIMIGSLVGFVVWFGA